VISVLPFPSLFAWLRGLSAGVRTTGGGAPVAPPAINELYHSRRLSLVRLAVLMVDDLPTAEDIVQDVFTALYRKYGPELRGVTDPNAYLITGVTNAARSALRRRRTARAYLPPPPDTVPAAEDEALLGEGDREMLRVLRGLTARQRQVLVLRYWSELSEGEIADTLRVSRGTVKSTAHRALSILRARLGER
jgi:RNA polymerase sigma-70 factor (sigma-E family)